MKTVLKSCKWTEKFACLQNCFHISISRSLENSSMNKKRTLFFAPLFNFVQHPNHSKIFHAFHDLLQHLVKKWLKKDFSNTLFRVIKTENHNASSSRKNITQRHKTVRRKIFKKRETRDLIGDPLKGLFVAKKIGTHFNFCISETESPDKWSQSFFYKD